MHRFTLYRSLGTGFLLAFALPGALVQAQSPTPDSAIEIVDLPPANEPLVGLWPTPRMIDNLILRLGARIGEEYDLDTTQQDDLNARLLRRWGEFARENRRDLQPLINDYLEKRLAMNPPTNQEVAEWSANALPIFRRLRHEAEAGEQEVREVLDSEQRAAFDARRPQRMMGLTLFEGQLKRWSVGKFDPAEWWDPPAGYEPQASSNRDTATGDGDGSASLPGTRSIVQDAPDAADGYLLPARVAGEFHAWEKYVIDFCDRFNLDRSQRNAAASILRELLNRARDHVYARRYRIAALEEKIAHGSGEANEAFEREVAELYGPIDHLYAQLVERIESLPTSGQRRQAQEVPPDIGTP
jgi:hypothetical protein